MPSTKAAARAAAKAAAKAETAKADVKVTDKACGDAWNKYNSGASGDRSESWSKYLDADKARTAAKAAAKEAVASAKAAKSVADKITNST
jgi:hypothetical protein